MTAIKLEFLFSLADIVEGLMVFVETRDRTYRSRRSLPTQITKATQDSMFYAFEPLQLFSNFLCYGVHVSGA